eukprot:814558-Lingulodinium_polyedra.AAC.1
MQQDDCAPDAIPSGRRKEVRTGRPRLDWALDCCAHNNTMQCIRYLGAMSGQHGCLGHRQAGPENPSA